MLTDIVRTIAKDLVKKQYDCYDFQAEAIVFQAERKLREVAEEYKLQDRIQEAVAHL